MSKKNKHKNITTIVKEIKPPCHTGFCQIQPRIFVGKASDIGDILFDVDVLVPLDSVSGKIWDLGWRGKILYFPVEDYSVLPEDVEKDTVEEILKYYNDEKSIAIFCLGGHGRTGYIASLVLGKLGIEDPIGLLRGQYCDKAVETKEQIHRIATFIGNPELCKKYRTSYDLYSGGYGDWREYESENYGSDYACHMCCSCKYYRWLENYEYNGLCDMYGDLKYKYSSACSMFAKYA